MIYYKYHGLGTKVLCQSKNLYFNWDKDGKRIMLLYTLSDINKTANKSINNIKVTKIKFNSKSKSKCECKTCISLQRRHK